MKFINKTLNSVFLHEIDRTIPFLGETEQYISPDDVKKSTTFQSMCLGKLIIITGDCTERIEQNLLAIQKGETLPAEPEPLEVEVRGHFFTNTGYAKSNRNLVLGLARSGCRVNIKPINGHIDGLNQMEIQQMSILHNQSSENAIILNSTVPSFAEPIFGRYSILYTTVESATVPEQFIDACEPYHEVWTTSQFCKEVLESSGLSKEVTVIPNSVNPGIYNMKTPPHSISPAMKGFTFLSVFGWNYRKGYDALLKAYLKAFTGDDDVSLLIVSRYDQARSGECKVEKEIRQIIAEHGGTNPPHIARCGRAIPEFEMPRLYRACQCFVLPSRGEGFGLPYMEASLCGLPVIATKHSGHTMFLNDENSFLVDIDTMSRLGDGTTNIHYWDGQLFPELKSDKFISDLGDQMKFVYHNYSSALERNENLRREIISKYTPDKVALLARKKLEDIWNSL